jgi:RND family efflux transporter MFP subunit
LIALPEGLNSMPCKWFHRGLTAAGLAGLFIAGASELQAADKSVYQGITKPSEVRDLVFNSPGIVAEESVKDGDTVKEGQVLAVQDATVDMADKAKLELKANSGLQVEAAQADYDSKVVELKRKQKMFDQSVLGASELEEAKLAVVIDEIRIRLAKEEQQEAKAELAEAEARIKLKRLVSPIDGIVKKINTHVGEAPSPDANKPSITVVKNDLIWIEVNLPKLLAMNLHTQQQMQVRYADAEKWSAAEVIFIDPVADARSGTQLVRMQMANPTGRQPGEQIQVKAPENVADAAAVDR